MTSQDIDSDSLLQSLYELKSELDLSVNQAEQEEIVRISAQLRSFLDYGELKPWAHYYLGYASYRLSSLFPEMDKGQGEELLDRGIDHLEEAVELDPMFAEAWALLGNCYGMKAIGLFSGMKYGLRSQKALERALEISSGNPRIHMMHGISLLFKPSIVGGSVSKALETFHESARLYDSWSKSGPLDPEWGQAENFAWMAQAHIRLEEFQEARDAYKQALYIKPGYYWVEEVLLPELNDRFD